MHKHHLCFKSRGEPYSVPFGGMTWVMQFKCDLCDRLFSVNGAWLQNQLTGKSNG